VRRPDTNSLALASEPHRIKNTSEFAVLRIKQRKRGWVPISRALIDDSRLQFDTRAIANWLISKPDGWQIRLVALPYLLQQRAGPGERMGRDRVRRMLRELENAGYLTRARSKKPDGRWGWRVDLSDTPVPLHRTSTIDGSAVDGSATDGSADDGSGVDLLNTLNNSRLDKLIPTTTEAGASEKAVAVVSVEVRYPQVLQGGHLKSARQLIEACPVEQRQAVLDELGAMHARGKVRSPLGLLRALTDKARRGEFSPHHSLSADLQSTNIRSPVHVRNASSEPQTASGTLVRTSEIAEQVIGKWRKTVKPNGS
jgi:hypothetical protein